MSITPNEKDVEEANSIYDTFRGRFGMRHKREDYVAALARAVMHKRRLNEHKELQS